MQRIQFKFFTGQGCTLKIFIRVGITVAIAFCFLVVGCGGVGVATAGVPAISQIIPQTIAAGSDNTSVQVVGAHINDATVVLWNGTPLSTTVVNDTTVAAPVESASLATPGVAELQLMNRLTGSKSEAFALSIASSANTSPLSITTTSLPSGTVGTPYSAALTATGGTTPYTWQFTSGTAPAGLSLRNNGAISGTPTTAGTYSVGLTVTDKSKPAQSRFIAFTVIIAPKPVTIAPLSITTSSLPSVTVGSGYSQTLKASGGSGVYSWSLASGSLPSGLTLSSAGVISGTTTTSGNSTFTVSVSDTGNPVQTKTASLSISVSATPLRIGTTSLPGGTVNGAYSQTLSVSGGTPGYVWSIASGSLPAGLSLSPSGVISGTPSATGTATFVASVTDSSNPAQKATVSLSINTAATPLNVSSANFTQVTYGRPYSATLQANGGTPGYKWSVASGNLPAGLSLDSTTGSISGTPLTGGATSFTAAVQDSGSPIQTAAAQVTINVSAAPLAITASTLPAVTVGGTYAQTLQATGGSSPYQWSITSGQLPAGMTLSPVTGTITGTPTTAGTSTFTATATDTSNPTQTASLVMSLAVNTQLAPASVAQLSISAPASTTGTVGSPYTQALGVSGGTGPYTWSFSDGFPAGLTLSPSGVVSGTPLPGSNGSYNVTVSVVDAGNPAQTASSTMSITIGASASPLSILSSTLASGTTGSAYSQTLQATGGTASYAWSLTSGSLPAGVTLSSNGAITGTPSSSGTSTFTATVTDSSSPVQTKSASLSIAISAARASTGGTTWFVRQDGGTLYNTSTNPTGQCSGKADSAYPGSGTNQACAASNLQYLWAASGSWIIAGGDTVVVRSCAPLPGEQNPAAPDCRIGPITNAGNCIGGNCYPPVPSGSSTAHTVIEGGCAYDGNCNPANIYPYTSNLAQLFGGFSVPYTLNLGGSKYVDIAGIEFTTHNGACTHYGSPQWPAPCSSSLPLSDYASTGILTTNQTSDVTLTDIYLHGFTASGIQGPIGGPIKVNRAIFAFNTFSGWNFGDDRDTPDAAGSSVTQTQVTMIGNGCMEEYPIVHNQFPAKACWDTNNGGFGDSWSGQDTNIDGFTCDQCTVAYNTKDGLIGPHTLVKTLSITRGAWYGNMGSQFKWGTQTNSSTLFQNNYVNGNCFAMSQQLPGAAQNFNITTSLPGSYLSGWCRAAGAPFAIAISASSSFLFTGNTIVSNIAPTTLQLSCVAAGTCSGTTQQYTDNIFLGYSVPASYGPFGGGYTPAIYYHDTGIAPPSDMVVHSTNNLFFGNRNDDCTGGYGGIALTSSGAVCANPMLTGQPSSYSSEPVFFNINLHPTAASPAIYAGMTLAGLTMDYYGVARPTPPTIGAVEP